MTLLVFLVRIFPHSDQKWSEYGQFLGRANYFHFRTNCWNTLNSTFERNYKKSKVLVFEKFYASLASLFTHTKWITATEAATKSVLWIQMFLEISQNSKFTEKYLFQSLFFHKVAGLRPATLLKKRLWHRCFPVNFVKFPISPILQNTSGRLLLQLRSTKLVLNDASQIIALDVFPQVNKKRPSTYLEV